MAISTHNKYVSIPDWFSSSSSTPVTPVEKPTNVTNVYYGGGGGTTGITEIPIDNKTVVWLDLVITVPIDNDKIIINAEGKITTSDVYDTLKIWELRQLTDGTNYIYTTYPVVTQLGITMYAGTDGLNLGNIYDGLPIDGVTLYWSYDSEGNKILKSAGSVDGEGGVSDFWALHNIPSWITVSKPYYTTSEISEGNNLYFTNARAVSALAETLKYYVTLGDTQTITGEKNFTGGLKVNGSPIYYDTLKKYWKLEGDLLVTGGVTMYGSDSSFTPSTIMDAIAVDGTTISKDGGVLKVIGGTGGGVADSVAWANITGKPTWIGSSKPSYSYSEITGAISTTELQNYLTQNSYLNVTSGDNRYLKLSGGTISNNGYALILNRESENTVWIQFRMQNEFVGAIGGENGALRFMDKNSKVNTVWHSGNDGNGSGLDADLLDGKHNGDLTAQYFSIGKILTSSDTINKLMSGVYCYINGDNPVGSVGDNTILLSFRNDGRTDMFQLANSGNEHTLYYRSATNIGNSYENWTNWRTFAFTDSNVASATKLNDNTTFTAWGQTFFTNGKPTSVSGAFNHGHIWIHNNDEINSFVDINANTSATLYLQYRTTGNTILCYGGGNVGVGTANPSAKFQVNGNASIHSSSAGVISLYRTTSDGGSYVDYYPRNQTSNKWRVGAGSVDEFFYEAPNGSNLARICHNATTGTRFEVGRRFLSVQPSGSDADRSVITLISNGDSPTDFIMGSGNYAWSITSRNSAEGHLLGFYSALSGQYAMRVYKEGNVLVTGGITMYSDLRKKIILNHVELSIKQIADAPLVEHYYNSDEKKTTHVGSIAQYWANMNDWFCKLDSEGFYTMEIQNAALASAISIARELDRYETKTDKSIKKLKKRIYELEKEVELLKAS